MSQIILYDGTCVFCNAATRFIIRHDAQGKFKFASLQSERGRQLIPVSASGKDTESLILLKSDQAFFKSNAVFQIARELDGGWRHLSVFRFLQGRFSDRIYDFIARHRYRLTSRGPECKIQDMSGNARFLTKRAE